MKKLLFTLNALLFLYPVLAQEHGKNFLDQPYIEVTGTAIKEVLPNEIYLKVMIHEKDIKKKTIQEMEQQMVEILENLGVNVNEQLAIKDLASTFQYHFILKDDVFTSKEYEIKVGDAQLAGKIIRELAKVDISNISVDRIAHSEIEQIKLAVKQEAIKNAKVKADAFALALDQKAGKAIHIQENSYNTVRHQLSGKVAGVRIRGVSSLKGTYKSAIDFEKIKVEAQVNAKFILE